MATTTNQDVLRLTVEFSGGLEMLFSNQKKHEITLPAKDEGGNPAKIAFLVRYLCKNTMNDHRNDLFMLDDTVRPGILVLIDDADWAMWEEDGEDTYEIQEGANVLFVSTLHGG